MQDLPPKSLRVAYFGPVDFPSPAANSLRMEGIAAALSGSGATVLLGSAGPGGRDSAALDVPVAFLDELPHPRSTKIVRIAQSLFGGSRAIKWASRLDPAPDVLVLYGSSYGYLARALRLSRRRRIPLILDMVEWYEASHLPGGRFGPFAILNALGMRLASRACGVIAISSFLADHYAARGQPVFIVPPLMTDAQSLPARGARGNKLVLSYVGNPAIKDAATVRNLVRLPSQLGALADRVEIRIAGVDAARLRELGEHSVPRQVELLGNVPRSSALEYVLSSDFTVLQRPRRRYAQAGFPTKIAESLWNGIPVLANMTSDLDRYIVDRKNGRILADDTLESLTSVVADEIRTRTSFDSATIQDDAFLAFSSSSYAAPLHDFVTSVVDHSARSKFRRVTSTPI